MLLGPAGRHHFSRGLCDIEAGAGTFSAYLGVSRKGYRQIHGH